ncbi:hypothetical protein FXN61_19070 [Lentzea sp. PSKA42]|uniref:Uncharacterized protein n=1 Tax=Lentzea indica TaxID=2604800 RepID=A0ABX1FJ07_9PSEU|nr:DUF6239 family natural product biosynthesis protein [Lentzea indica]NKE58797.1 hypothetical protein [Lentzea indica]
MRPGEGVMGPLLAQGHDHTLTVPITIGPMVLRVALMAAIPAVAAFAVLRPFVPAPSRRSRAVVTATSALAAILLLMVAGAIDIPGQAVVLLLAALACPLVAVFGRHVDRFRTLVSRTGPWVLLTATALAVVKLVHGRLADGPPEKFAVVLYTGALLALLGLSWSAVCRPRGRPMKTLVHGTAAVSALIALVGTTQATLSRLPD